MSLFTEIRLSAFCVSGANMKNEETKRGARNSRKDQERLQTMHDYAVENGAVCKSAKDIDPDALVYFGDAVKALGDGKVGGYLVRYSTPSDPDLTGDYFDAKTNIVAPEVLPVLYQHGFDEHMGKRVFGSAKTGKDDIGQWIEAQLDLRDEYEKAVYALAEKGKLGWSSGALSHLVEREPAGKAYHITSWFIGEASLTPTPAEFRNSVIPIKSIIPEAASADMEERQEVKTAALTAKENNMEKEEIKALFDEQANTIKTLVQTEAEAAAKKAVDDVLDKLPEVKAKMNGNLQVTVDEADRPFKNIGDQLAAIAGYSKNGRMHPRIKGLQAMELKAALGANEAVPSQGEFLLEPTITTELMKPIHDNGVFVSNVNRLPVGPNSNSGWINGVDETSRATGSRWGGVRGYHTSEAGSMTGSKPKFRRINWELHKVYVLMYATDEVLSDASQLQSIFSQSAAEEIDFMMNDDILNGIGGDRPVGVLNSPALISVGRYAVTDIQSADIENMWVRMPARNKSRSAWYVNSEVSPKLNGLYFTAGSTGILSPYVTYGPDGAMRIKGRPVIETEFNAALGTAGDILLADMNEYLFWQKGATESAASIHVQFLTDETVFRFINRYDGMTARASALTPYKGTATQSPFVTLAATTG